VLGYKDRNEPSGGARESTEFAKIRLREKLSFYRFLMQKGLSQVAISKEMENFESHIETLFSGRGGYDFNLESVFEDFTDVIYHPTIFTRKEYDIKIDENSRMQRLKEMSEYINEYGEKNYFLPSTIDTDIDFSTIDTL